MKLFIQKENVNVEVREIQSLSKDSEILFFFLNGNIRPQEIDALEQSLSLKTGKKVIVLPSILKETIKSL
ncbi:hypothetical protein [Salipaludibacillus sp. CF4.18]|uniref:hypothetical protein n=1 Tax=Salipaludibacillus sp. CF4.18 TaxID=3373081 RepID=UPI003EE7523B